MSTHPHSNPAPSLHTLGEHVVARRKGSYMRLECRTCPAWWTTATDLGDAQGIAQWHDNEHARWADADARA